MQIHANQIQALALRNSELRAETSGLTQVLDRTTTVTRLDPRSHPPSDHAQPE